MNKAKIISRYSVHVIDYDKEVAGVDTVYKVELQKNGVTDDVINPILKKKEDKRSVEELLLIIKRKEIEDTRTERLAEIETFKEFVPTNFNGELEEFDSPKPYYIEEGNAVIQKWEVVNNDRAKVAAKISELKSELDESDYKVMKCYEAAITESEEMPYDVKELTEERQAKRDAINRLETILKSTEPIDIQAKVTK